MTVLSAAIPIVTLQSVKPTPIYQGSLGSLSGGWGAGWCRRGGVGLGLAIGGSGGAGTLWCLGRLVVKEPAHLCEGAGDEAGRRGELSV